MKRSSEERDARFAKILQFFFRKIKARKWLVILASIACVCLGEITFLTMDDFEKVRTGKISLGTYLREHERYVDISKF